MAKKRKMIEKNTDSLFKKVAINMPEGYYSGDKPNPNLKKFVEDHIKENPYNPETDNYNVNAFDKPLNATKATAIYNMHTYWSKKPHNAIREYIKHYTKPGDLVLDPFCGSGGSALAALMEGRKAIAIDRSPAATFITKNYCTPVDTNELQMSFDELEKKIKPEIDWLFETKCDRCDGNATTLYTVYSQVFQCPRCLNKIPLSDCIEKQTTAQNGKSKNISICPYCFKNGISEEISTSGEKFGIIPVLISYECKNGCKPKRGYRNHNDSNPKNKEYFIKYDIGKVKEIEENKIPYWYPQNRMMNVDLSIETWGLLWRRGIHKNINYISDFYTKRNLWALSIIREYIKYNNDFFYFPFSACLLGVSRMVRDSNTATMPGTYFIPSNSKEIYVLNSFVNKFLIALEGIDSINFISNSILISTQSAIDLTNVKTNSIDYIFTDPPYADKVQYGELNFIWEAWLGFDTHWHEEEIIVSDVRGKTVPQWESLMKKAMAECFRVLKPGRWLSLCYHDSSEGTWSFIQDVMAEVGFIVDKSENVLFIDTDQKSFNQITADKVTKRDLVINFRKPKIGELKHEVKIEEKDNDTTFFEKVKIIIEDFLTVNPGSSKDRIYDEVVSRMVRKGQMESHNFESILKQVAEEVKEPIKKNLFENKDADIFGSHEISRWFLKENDELEIDTAETKKEDAAAKKIAAYMEKYLTDNPEKNGVHYSEVFEFFINSVRYSKDKPRRELVVWLLDYFYKTEDGTYRLPLNEEEEKLKAEIRSKGSNRKIKRYINLIIQGSQIPDSLLPSNATLVEWIRQCKLSGMFEEGKLLYEKGGIDIDSLSEKAQADLEEDYQVCLRMLNR